MTAVSPAITDQQSKIQILKDVTSSLINSLSSEMFAFGLGLMLLQTTQNAISFGLDLIVTPIISLTFMLPVGLIADKYSHKKILLISLLGRLMGLGALSLTFNLFQNNAKMISIVIFLIINAISNNFTNTTYAASIHELVNPRYLAKLSSLSQAATASANIFAFVLGVFLYSLNGFDFFIAFEIGATSIAWLLLLAMKFHSIAPLKIAKNDRQLPGFKASFKYLSHHSVSKVIIFLDVVINFLLSAFNIGLPYVIIKQLHAGSKLVGFLEAGISLGILIGSFLMSFSKDNHHFLSRLLLNLNVVGLSTILFGFLLNETSTSKFQLPYWGFFLIIILGISISWINIATNIYFQTTVPAEILGKLFSLLQTAATASLPFGTITYTFLFQMLSTGAIIFIISGLLMISYLLFLIPSFHKSIKNHQ